MDYVELTLSEYHQRLGEYLGFPQCCIDDFNSRNSSANRKLRGTGYVPCQTCNETYTEEELAHNINLNRECPDKFPKWKGSNRFGNNFKFVEGLSNDLQNVY